MLLPEEPCCLKAAKFSVFSRTRSLLRQDIQCHFVATGKGTAKTAVKTHRPLSFFHVRSGTVAAGPKAFDNAAVRPQCMEVCVNGNSAVGTFAETLLVEGVVGALSQGF